MEGTRLFSANRGVRLKALVVCLMLLGQLPLTDLGQMYASGAAGMTTARLASIAAADPDLCALLPTGPGLEISSSDRTRLCKVTNTNQANADDAGAQDIQEITIEKFSSVDDAHSQLKAKYSAATANNFGRWDPTTEYGDTGDNGYIIQPINLNNGGGAFARCGYVVIGTAHRIVYTPTRPDHDPALNVRVEFLRKIDESLSKICGSTEPTPDILPDVLRLTYPGSKTSCSLKDTEAGVIRVLRRPHPDSGQPAIWYQTNDGTAALNGKIPAKGAYDSADRFPYPLHYGVTVQLPTELPQKYEDRWYISIELGPSEIYQLGPTGSFTVPCAAQDTAKVGQGTMEILVKANATAPAHRVETANAIISPASGGHNYTVSSVDAQADPNSIGIRLSVDTRDPAKTGITLYAGTAQVAPKSGGAGITLTAGQHVDVTQAGVSAATNVIDIPGVTSQNFPETGKVASGIFMDYWLTHGGLAQQGYPLSGLLREKSDLNGQTYTVQYYERAVFEFHPEFAAPNDVLLSQLGTFQYKKKYPNGAPGQRPNQAAGRLFTETNHWVGGKFYAYWQSHGGLAQQGLPLSDEFTEVSETNGKTYTVQYYERAVFEFHPENAAPNDVLLSLLGAFQYSRNYQGGPGGPGGGSNPTATPTGGGGGNPNCSATTNIAAASNGASIAGASSDYGAGWKPAFIIDGNLNTGWASDADKNTNQYVIVALPGGQTYNVNKVRINPWNTAPSCCPDDSTKDFEIRVSTTDANPNSFRTVFKGTTPKENAFFDYTFAAVQAKYVMLFVVNNYGGRWIEVKEFEVYQQCSVPPPPPGATATPQLPPPPAATATTPAGGQCSDIPANQNMTVSPTNCARAGSTFVFEATGFNPNETIGAYATGPDGSVYGGNFQLTADANGNVHSPNGVTLTTSLGTPPGIYALTMEGVTTHRTAIGYIKLLAP